MFKLQKLIAVFSFLNRHPVRQYPAVQQSLPAPSQPPVNGSVHPPLPRPLFNSQQPPKFTPAVTETPPLTADARTVVSIDTRTAPNSDKVDARTSPQVAHHSRLDAFQARPPANRSFSPLQAYQNHIASIQRRDEPGNARGLPIGLCSPMPQRKFGGGSGPSSLPVSHFLLNFFSYHKYLRTSEMGFSTLKSTEFKLELI